MIRTKSIVNNAPQAGIASDGLKYLTVSILVVIAFVGGIFTSSITNTFGTGGEIAKDVQFVGDLEGSNRSEIDQVDFDLFWEVWDTMRDQYVDPAQVDEEEMFYSAIKGFVSSYGDPATVFLDPEETEQFNESTAGNFFSGIGAELGYEEGRVVIVAPLKGSPALKSGLKAGDVILSVDGEELATDDTVFDAVTIIRGESGTEVVLEVAREGSADPLEFKITRGEITLASMEYEFKDGVAIFDVSRFTEATLRGWEGKWDEMVKQAEKDGAKRVIIDLRGNPGGYFDAAVYAAGEFLPRGTVVAQQEDRQGRNKQYKVDRNGKLQNVELVVLVDEGSASASEILAGALQDNERATIIGENTYGKGTAQSVIELQGGSSMHITILKWLLPSGKWLNRENVIEPNIEVALSDEDFKQGKDPQMDKAVEIVKK